MTANLKIGPCPNAATRGRRLYQAKSDCDEVTHAPDAEDLFTCSKCGAEVPAKYAYSE